MNSYRATVVKPKRPGERKFARFHYIVLAEDDAAAKRLLDEHCDHFKPEYVAIALGPEYEQGERVIDSGITMLDDAELRKLKGESAKSKPARLPVASDKPLGETQAHVLRSLSRSPYPGGGWLWDTDSGTKRILETLRLRCLPTPV